MVVLMSLSTSRRDSGFAHLGAFVVKGDDFCVHFRG
jgi:hypothetical protein